MNEFNNHRDYRESIINNAFKLKDRHEIHKALKPLEASPCWGKLCGVILAMVYTDIDIETSKNDMLEIVRKGN